MYTGLLVWWYLCSIWPPVFPLNLTYISYFSSHYPEQTCPKHTSNIPSTKSHIHFLPLRSFIQGICPGPRLPMNFHNKLFFYGEELLAPRPTPNLEDHPLSAVRNWLFNIFEATLNIWRLSPPSATWGRTMLWWQGTHLTHLTMLQARRSWDRVPIRWIFQFI
jgi:hypothetical protein